MPITDKRWREKIQGEVVTLLFSVVIDRELLISWAGKMWKHKIGQELKAVFIFVVISKIMKTILNRRKSGKILDHEKITKNKINGKNLKSNFDVAIFESLIDFRCKHACNLHACQSI